jgi:hypothetical protein
MSLYLPVTNPVSADVKERRSRALYLPQDDVTAIITALLVKVSVRSNRHVGTVDRLRNGRHMDRGLILGRRDFSSKRPHMLWGP